MKYFRTTTRTRTIFYLHALSLLIWLVLLLISEYVTLPEFVRPVVLVFGLIAGSFLLMIPVWLALMLEIQITPTKLEIRRLAGVPRSVVAWSQIESITLQPEGDIRIDLLRGKPIWLEIAAGTGIDREAVFKALRVHLDKYGAGT